MPREVCKDAILGDEVDMLGRGPIGTHPDIPAGIRCTDEWIDRFRNITGNVFTDSQEVHGIRVL